MRTSALRIALLAVTLSFAGSGAASASSIIDKVNCPVTVCYWCINGPDNEPIVCPPTHWPPL